MATTSQRLAALEAWKAAHLINHVTTGHPTTGVGVHGHPHAASAADGLTVAEVTQLKVLIAGGGGGTTPIPNPPPGPTPDITAPVISGIAQVVTTTTATITWTTNEAATGLVVYGLTTAYGSTTSATASGTSHSRTLTGLTPGQTYQYQVRATDASPAANVGLSGNRSFTTTAPTTGRTLYMSPTGSDSAAGTIAAPFKTLRSRVGAFALLPGDTILVRGGTHLEPGTFGSTWIPAVSGTLVAPITVKAYPGEVPVFDGASAVGQAFVIDGRAYMIFEDLKFQNYNPIGNGTFIIGGAQFITLRRITMTNNVGAVEWTDHAVYIGGASEDILIEYCTISGTTGAAVQIAVGSGNPGNVHSERVRVLNCTFTNNGFGVINQHHDDGEIANNVISGNSIETFRISHTINNEIHHNRITDSLAFTFSPPPPTQTFLEHDNCINAAVPFQDYGGPTNYTLAQWKALSGQGTGTTVGVACGDITAPVPINITATAITTTTAEIGWSSVEAGNGQVEYGLTIGYGSLTTLEASYLTAHSQTLTSLVPNKLYHYRVRSSDAAGNLGLSSDRTFTTLNTTPTPSPGRRFAAPTTTVTVAVPGGIDATGATDVRAALLSFIAGLANGTRITATSGARYKVSSGLRLTNRQHLVFDWTGVTLHNTGGGSGEDGCFYLDNCQDIALIGINYIGANPTPGRMSSAGEHSATVYVSDGLRIEMSGGSSKDVHGDGTVTINRDGQYVWVHDMTVTNCGRMAAAVVWGSHVWIERNTVGPCGFAIWDIEPESASNGQTMTDIHFLDNDAWGWSPQSDGTLWHGFFFGASAGVGSTAIVDNIHVERNRVTGPGSTQSTLQSYIGSQNTPFGRRTNGTFLDNTGQTGPIQQAQPGLVTFRHCDNWTYGRNGAAPTSGSLYGFVDSTGMTAV